MLDQVPSIKDLDIEKRFCDLKNFNEGRNNNDENDDDDDNNIGQSPGPSQYPSSSLPPTLPISPVALLKAMQRFLFPLQKVAEAIGQELTATRPQKITLLDKIKKIFPNSRKIIDTIEEEPPSSSFSENYADETDVQLTIKELNNGKLPFELKFFSGDEEDKNLLIESAK